MSIDPKHHAIAQDLMKKVSADMASYFEETTELWGEILPRHLAFGAILGSVMGSCTGFVAGIRKMDSELADRMKAQIMPQFEDM